MLSSMSVVMLLDSPAMHHDQRVQSRRVIQHTVRVTHGLSDDEIIDGTGHVSLRLNHFSSSSARTRHCEYG